MISKEEVKKIVNSEKVCIGTDVTIKNLRQSKLSKVLITKNCPKEVVSDVDSLTKSGDHVELLHLEESNEELGIICKKPYHISVIGVLKK